MARPPERPASLDRLPEETRAEVGRLRLQGRTIDEILSHLKQLDVEVSRSALGRHLKGLATLRERMNHSREMATALVSQFGDQPDNKLQRLNLELMHGVIMQTITASGEDEDGEPKPVTFCPEDARFLADALAKLATAEKTNADRTLKLKAEAKKEAVAEVEKVATQEGLSSETLNRIRAGILGVAPK